MAAPSALSGVVAHTLHLGACLDCCYVLADPDEAVCGNVPHRYAWSIECPGLEAGRCQSFWECRTCAPEDVLKAEKTYFQDGDDYVVLHGVAHEYVNGMFMTEGSQCWVQVAPYIHESIADLQEEQRLVPGSYPVHFDTQDESVTLSLLSPGEVLANVLLHGEMAARKQEAAG